VLQVPVRQPNGLRAHDNYRRKLKFLHEEQFKYQTYIHALEDGLRLRVRPPWQIDHRSVPAGLSH
jgi:hypothetical protein